MPDSYPVLDESNLIIGRVPYPAEDGGYLLKFPCDYDVTSQVFVLPGQRWMLCWRCDRLTALRLIADGIMTPDAHPRQLTPGRPDLLTGIFRRE